MILRRNKDSQESLRATRNPDGQKAPVFSYYSSRSGQDTHNVARNMAPGIKKKRNIWWLNYFPSLLSLAIVVAAGLYLTTLSVKPKIDISSPGNRPMVVQDVEVYQSSAEKLMKKSLLNRSKLTIDTDKLASQLAAEFPELGEIVVTIPLVSRRPVIQVQPSTPAIVLSGQGGSFIVDVTGRPVLKASQLVSATKDMLPKVADDSGSSIEIGKQLLTTDLVAFIGLVQAHFNAKNVRVQSYTLPALANELHVRLEGQGYYIKLNTETDARLQVGTYLAVIEKLTADGVVPAEYIDVRVEERAYYR